MKLKVFSSLIIGILLYSSILGQGFEHFVTTRGNALIDGEDTLRFISWNIPNLNYVEDELSFTATNPYGLPTEYEMRDAFETIQQMGGRVIRIYTIPVRNKSFPEEAPTYVESPGVFNEEAFKVTDMMLALANEYQIRIIFSLLNNWQWMGGRPEYAAFRDKKPNDFWTDPQLIADFKETIQYTLNRTNTITNIKYKDDKAILCWETGNELGSPYPWIKEIAAYIKKLDKNHLLMDGFNAIDARPMLEASIKDKNIDIVTSHHYERSPLDMAKHIDKKLKLLNGRKPFIIGEFGFESTSGLEMVMDQIIANQDIAGALSWSIRYHHRNGGFYWHSEPLGLGVYKAYHWPGFASGDKYDEKNFLSMYREKAFEIQGMEAPPLPIPKAPVLLPIVNVADIRWQGSAGASGYHVERTINLDSAWKTIAHNVSDAAVQYFPNFHDKSAKVGQTYYYRVHAENEGGKSICSNIVGPVRVESQAVIDNMFNYGVLFDMHNVKTVTGEDRTFKEIDSRIAGDYGAEVIYRVPGKFLSFVLYAFEKNNWGTLDLMTSTDGKKWQKIDASQETFSNKEKNYNYAVANRYTYQGDEDIAFVKIRFKNKVQLARAEVHYK